MMNVSIISVLPHISGTRGDKLVNRFHAHCYWYLTKCLDTHDLGRNRGGLENALKKIEIPAKVIGIKTDRLVPTDEQKLIARFLPNGEYVEIESEFGHDGFLIEGEQIGMALGDFLK